MDFLVFPQMSSSLVECYSADCKLNCYCYGDYTCNVKNTCSCNVKVPVCTHCEAKSCSVKATISSVP